MMNRLDAAQECDARDDDQGSNARLIVFLLQFLVISISLVGQTYKLPEQNDRWAIQPDGSIFWKIDHRLPHNDQMK